MTTTTPILSPRLLSTFLHCGPSLQKHITLGLIVCTCGPLQPTASSASCLDHRLLPRFSAHTDMLSSGCPGAPLDIHPCMLCQFPRADHKLDALKHQKSVPSHSRRLETQSITMPKSRGQQGCTPSGSSRGEPISCCFLLLVAAGIPWLAATSLQLSRPAFLKL